ncbi:hypothetical protein LguiB_026932 [Lonicera macranthoides]
MATGQILFHRFYCKKPFGRFNAKRVAASCVWLASKLEESPRKAGHVLNVFHLMECRRDNLPVEYLDSFSKKYSELKMDLIATERHLLKEMGFICHTSLQHDPDPPSPARYRSISTTPLLHHVTALPRQHTIAPSPSPPRHCLCCCERENIHYVELNERNRISEVYRHGVEDFINFAVTNDIEKLSTIICPCVKCRNKLRFPAKEVRNHLFINGINKTYTTWLLHGERPLSTQHLFVEHVEIDGTLCEEDIGNVGAEMGNLVDACYGVQDEYNVNGEVGETGASEERDAPNAKYNEYKRLAMEKLQMKEFKDIPSNKWYIEGSIAESYIVVESVRYGMESMPNPLEGNHRRTHEAFLKEDCEFSDTGPLLDDKITTLETHQFQQIRRWVLFRLHVDGLKEYYRFEILHIFGL